MIVHGIVYYSAVAQIRRGKLSDPFKQLRVCPFKVLDDSASYLLFSHDRSLPAYQPVCHLSLFLIMNRPRYILMCRIHIRPILISLITDYSLEISLYIVKYINPHVLHKQIHMTVTGISCDSGIFRYQISETRFACSLAIAASTFHSGRCLTSATGA